MDNIIKKLKNDPFNYADTLTIKQLEEILEYAADKYYNTNTSIISDAIYDMLIDFLKLKAPKSKTLKKIGSSVKKSKDKVKLDYWLGSMDKIKPPSNKLEKWLSRYKEPYYLTDKLDGVSGLLVYTKDGNIKLFTRGTATHGLNITPLLKYLSNIPSYENMEKFVKKNKLKGTKNLIAFRGELIISNKVFKKNWSKTMKNARNAVAGLVNSKSINPKLAGDTKFVVYEIVEPSKTIKKQLKLIKETKLEVVHSKKKRKLDYDFLSDYLLTRRKKAKYVIDGIIVTNNDKHKRNISGNPKYAFAFKDVLADQIAQTEVVDVEWKISKDGYINPTLVLKPVEIGGVEISRVTAFNAKFIVDNSIAKGAKIELIRSGDVIPYIKKVLKRAKKPDLPKGKWHWNKTEVDIICDELKCKDVQVKNIYHFFSSLDTKGLGERVVEKIYDSGLTEIVDILKATSDDFLKVSGFKQKSADNLVASIKKAMMNIKLQDLMGASNKLGHGMGSRRAKSVLDVYPNLLTEYKKWSKDTFLSNIKEIPSWKEKTSKMFVDNFDDFIKFYNSIKKYITLEKSKKVKKGKLSGQKIVMSGFRDNEIKTKLESIGAKVSTSVSKNTDYLVVKDKDTIEENTGKVKKAKDLGIKIITKEELVKLL